MKDTPKREVAIFVQATKMPIHERAAFLRRACAGDENLRRKLEALLNASDRSGAFLEEPAISETIASLLREMAVPAGGKRRKNSEAKFQKQPRKRKGI
jgi:hypothetical protein